MMRRGVAVIALTMLVWASALSAQEGAQLGTRVIGDGDSEFGLLIAKWLDADGAGPPAPALAAPALEAIDPWVLDRQLELRQALRRPAALTAD